jgi:hypothetical protein
MVILLAPSSAADTVWFQQLANAAVSRLCHTSTAC